MDELCSYFLYQLKEKSCFGMVFLRIAVSPFDNHHGMQLYMALFMMIQWSPKNSDDCKVLYAVMGVPTRATELEVKAGPAYND